MSPFEIITSLLSVAAIIISLIALRKTSSSTSANLELYINERITNTKDKVNEISITMSPLITKENKSEDEKKLLESYGVILKSAIENNLNAYEETCAKYLDNKVDKKRFMKTYRTEIRQLVENERLKEKFDALTTRYKAITKVYNEWENLEK